MWPNPQETKDLVTFTEEILNGKVPFFVQCSRSGADFNSLNFASFYVEDFFKMAA